MKILHVNRGNDYPDVLPCQHTDRTFFIPGNPGRQRIYLHFPKPSLQAFPDHPPFPRNLMR